MQQTVRGTVMVITGASSRFGRAAARLFAAEEAKLALVTRSGDKLMTLAKEIGGEPLVVPTHITRPGDVEIALRSIEQHFGWVDILFANAGGYVAGEAVQGDPDEWDRVIALNVNAVFRCLRAGLPRMIARKSGDIVVTSSISGHQAIHWEPVYSTTKHAHGVRRQVAPHNVRVGSLAPGAVLNELWGLTDPEEIERGIASHSGLRSEDVAESLLFTLTRPANVTIRDLVMLPQNQDI